MSKLERHEYADVVRFVSHFTNYRLYDPDLVRNYDTSRLSLGWDVHSEAINESLANEISQSSSISEEEEKWSTK